MRRSWAAVWSVSTSIATPRRASSGSTSAMLPTSPTDSACRSRFAPLDAPQRVVEIVGHHVAVAGLDAPADAARIDVDAEKCGPVHGRGQRLRPAHAAEAAGDDQPARRAMPPKCLRAQAANVS